jgi:hypothetical protein
MLKVIETEPRWDFPVHTVPVFAELGPYTKTQVTGYKSVIRSDTSQPLSIVGSNYEVFTHQQAADAVEPLIRHFGEPTRMVSVEREGARVVLTYLFKNHTVDVKNRKVGDKVALELKAINSYNQQTSITFLTAARVLRCLNGMTVAHGTFALRFRHTKAQVASVELPKPELIWKTFEGASTQWNQWGERDVTPQDSDFIRHQSQKFQIVGQKMLKKFNDEFEQSKTYWDLYNAYTRVLTHEMGRVQESAKIERFGKLNTIFSHALKGEFARALHDGVR